MKKIFLLFLTVCVFQGAKDPGSGSPEGLMVEFIREPEKVKILDLRPEFSWIVPQSAKIQTAYQMLVATERKKLELNTGNIWDSGKTLSCQSSEVEYGGKVLSSNTTYFWKVRIWNSSNRSSDYSEIQSFTTGDPGRYATTSNRFIISLNKPEKLVKTKGSHYFIDFGKDAFGTLLLKIKPDRNDTIIIHLGEKLSGENRIDKNPGGTIRYQRVFLPVKPSITEYTIILPPDPRNTGPAAIHLPDSFGVVTPFRYCELENCNTELSGENIFQKAYSYFFNDHTSSFTSSDTTLNRVWNICKYSMKATSFAGIYVDGDRERIPYEADAYINQLGHYYTDREYSMARMTNEYFIKHPTWPTEWILHTVPMFYNDFMFTGNIESLKAYYDNLKLKTLSALAREDGLISSKLANNELMKSLGFADPKERIRDIVDWPPAQKDTGWKLATPEGERDGYDMREINTVVNAFYYHNLVLMSAVAGYLGRQSDSSNYQNLAVKVRNAFNRTFFDKSKGIYTDGENSVHSSLHANMMALAFDLVPENNVKSVAAFIKSRGMACSVYGSQYLLEALYRAGEADYAMSLLTAGNDRSWWNMIKSGSTITMEAWDMRYKPNSDWNHAWGAAPANIIPGYMWGIAPVEPGFSGAIIRPQLSSLRESGIKVPTIRGPIEAVYNATKESLEYIITIPGNMKCNFILPAGTCKMVKLNGKKQNQGNRNLKLDPGVNRISIINAGS